MSGSEFETVVLLQLVIAVLIWLYARRRLKKIADRLSVLEAVYNLSEDELSKRFEEYE
jgi:hypothetical protein